MGQMISIDALDGSGSFDAYCAMPQGVPKAAIIVIQEIFGVNPGIRKMADDWADLGYAALAPDLFWRLEPGVQLDADVEDELKKAYGLMQEFDLDTAIKDVEAVIKKARSLTSGKVGLVGYCLGGRIAFLAATRTDADANVGYYGGGIDKLLGERHAIGKPLLLHFGKEDAHIGADVQKTIHEALDGNPHVTIHDYDGVGHAFARAFGRSRNEAAANLADGRTRAFFAQHLG